MARKSMNQLKSDHQRILQALDVLRVMTEHIEADESVAREDIAELLEFLQCFAHEYHDGKEQRLLLPALSEPATTQPALQRIASDHLRMHIIIEDLREALAQQRTSRLVPLALAYIELLTTHIFTEDRFLFAAMEKNLSPDADEQLLNAFDTYEPRLRDYSHSRFESVVPRLARKYSVPQCV